MEQTCQRCGCEQGARGIETDATQYITYADICVGDYERRYYLCSECCSQLVALVDGFLKGENDG